MSSIVDRILKNREGDTKFFKLDSESIDQISDCIEAFLSNAGAERREIASNRLAVECCLEIWGAQLGKENECILKSGSEFKRKYLELQTPGAMRDPSNVDIKTSDNSQEMQLLVDNTGLLASIGYMPEYRYTNGNNILRIWDPVPKKKTISAKTVIPIVVGILIVLAKVLIPPVGQAIYDYAISPVYSVFMRMLSAVCGPLVLFSIITSICGMGDMASFGKTGTVVFRRFMISSFALMAIAGIFVLFFFPITGFQNGELGSGIQGLIQMIVEIVPPDIVSPFVTGNAIQIVFIGLIIGVALMILGNVVEDLSRIVKQLQRTVLQVMSFLGVIMPYFMEVALLKIIMSCSLSQIATIIKPVLIAFAALMIMIVLETVIVSRKTKTSVGKLLKNTYSASLIALTTSSSTAAIGEMTDNCVDKLGVDENVANFAIPLGQVIFKPAPSLVFFIIALFSAELAGVAINPVFILMNLIVSWILGTSMAPVAGAMTSCLSILYLQLGIPQEYIAFAIGVSMLVDNAGTMTGVQLLQEEVFASNTTLENMKKGKRNHWTILCYL